MREWTSLRVEDQLIRTRGLRLFVVACPEDTLHGALTEKFGGEQVIDRQLMTVVGVESPMGGPHVPEGQEIGLAVKVEKEET